MNPADGWPQGQFEMTPLRDGSLLLDDFARCFAQQVRVPDLPCRFLAQQDLTADALRPVLLLALT